MLASPPPSIVRTGTFELISPQCEKLEVLLRHAGGGSPTSVALPMLAGGGGQLPPPLAKVICLTARSMFISSFFIFSKKLWKICHFKIIQSIKSWSCAPSFFFAKDCQTNKSPAFLNAWDQKQLQKNIVISINFADCFLSSLLSFTRATS